MGADKLLFRLFKAAAICYSYHLVYPALMSSLQGLDSCLSLDSMACSLGVRVLVLEGRESGKVLGGALRLGSGAGLVWVVGSEMNAAYSWASEVMRDAALVAKPVQLVCQWTNGLSCGGPC